MFVYLFIYLFWSCHFLYFQASHIYVNGPWQACGCWVLKLWFPRGDRACPNPPPRGYSTLGRAERPKALHLPAACSAWALTSQSILTVLRSWPLSTTAREVQSLLFSWELYQAWWHWYIPSISCICAFELKVGQSCGVDTCQGLKV